MKIILITFLMCFSLYGESKTDKHIRALEVQITDLKEQLRKEQFLSGNEKQLLNQTNATLEASQKQVHDLSSTVETLRSQWQLHQKNDASISAFNNKILSAKPVEVNIAVAKDVPRIERKLDAIHQANSEVLNRTADAVKKDMDRIERKVDAATGLAKGADIGTARNSAELQKHDKSIEWISAWGIFNSCLITIVIGLNLFSYWKSK